MLGINERRPPARFLHLRNRGSVRVVLTRLPPEISTTRPRGNPLIPVAMSTEISRDGRDVYQHLCRSEFQSILCQTAFDPATASSSAQEALSFSAMMISFRIFFLTDPLILKYCLSLNPAFIVHNTCIPLRRFGACSASDRIPPASIPLSGPD